MLSPNWEDLNRAEQKALRGVAWRRQRARSGQKQARKRLARLGLIEFHNPRFGSRGWRITPRGRDVFDSRPRASTQGNRNRRGDAEGVDYVVCPECNSHILITQALRGWIADRGDLLADEPGAVLMGFSCDWDPCLASFTAKVIR